MVDESETRIDALDAEATMFKKQAESTDEMMKNVRLITPLFRPYP